MKFFAMSAIILTVFSAHAVPRTQRISCIHAEGKGTVNILLSVYVSKEKRIEGKGEVRLTGFWKPASRFGKKLSEASGYNNLPESKVKYAQVNFADMADGEGPQYQLQFNAAVLGKNFENEKADLVIMADTFGDPSPTSGFSLICRGKL